MNEAQLFAIMPLVATAAYAVLLIALVVRTGLGKAQSRWFAAFLIASVIWSLTLALIPQSKYTDHNAKMFAASATLIGATTATFIGRPADRRWLLMGAIPLALALLSDLVWPFPPPLEIRRGAWKPPSGELLATIAWVALHVIILLILWRDYRRTRLPWHANRLLHWAIFSVATGFGELLTIMPSDWVAIVGQAVRFVSVAGLFHATTSHRLVDVRAQIRNGLAFVLVALVSAIPAAIVLSLSLWLTDTYQLELLPFYTVAMIVIFGGFVIYQPVRRLVKRVIFRYFVGQEFHTGAVVRRYSQAIARTLDVEQLAQGIIGMIGELLQTTRGALLLVNPTATGYDVEMVPNAERGPQENMHFGADSPFIGNLLEEHNPLLQYDIDFGPNFANLAEDERQWLVDLGMELYVPIHDGDRLDGLVAIGPKESGMAYRANELELMQILAEQTVIALQNARLYSELNRQNERIRSLNIDLRQQNVRLEILDRIKSDFITIASNELRTPLTQIKGYADILTHLNDNGPLDQDKTRQIMDVINRATSRLENLITAMLDASELEVSGMELMHIATRLERVVQDAVEPLEPALRERRIHLQCEGLQELPKIDADYQRLVQAFGNIMGNAVKYTPDDGVITVSGSLVPGAGDKGDHVEIVVSDTGIGIDPQYHDLIFEKFFRVGNPELHSTGATKFKGGGPGLGLHIAQGVIEAHGGRIWVESNGEDEEQMPGSRFYIVLPVVRDGEPDATEQEPEEQEESGILEMSRVEIGS